MDVLDPARGHAREHAVHLAAGEAAVHEHDQERVEDARVAGHDLAERRLEQEGGQQRDRRPEHLHRTPWVMVSSGSGMRTTITSSSVLNCAEGVTTISLKSPLPRAAERTRPTTSPAG